MTDSINSELIDVVNARVDILNSMLVNSTEHSLDEYLAILFDIADAIYVAIHNEENRAAFTYLFVLEMFKWLFPKYTTYTISLMILRHMNIDRVVLSYSNLGCDDNDCAYRVHALMTKIGITLTNGIVTITLK